MSEPNVSLHLSMPGRDLLAATLVLLLFVLPWLVGWGVIVVELFTALRRRFRYR